MTAAKHSPAPAVTAAQTRVTGPRGGFRHSPAHVTASSRLSSHVSLRKPRFLSGHTTAESVPAGEEKCGGVSALTPRQRRLDGPFSNGNVQKAQAGRSRPHTPPGTARAATSRPGRAVSRHPRALQASLQPERGCRALQTGAAGPGAPSSILGLANTKVARRRPGAGSREDATRALQGTRRRQHRAPGCGPGVQLPVGRLSSSHRRVRVWPAASPPSSAARRPLPGQSCSRRALPCPLASGGWGRGRGPPSLNEGCQAPSKTPLRPASSGTACDPAGSRPPAPLLPACNPTSLLAAASAFSSAPLHAAPVPPCPSEDPPPWQAAPPSSWRGGTRCVFGLWLSGEQENKVYLCLPYFFYFFFLFA
nr:proline-rich protein 36-like isoform X2 [Microcebus murinus]